MTALAEPVRLGSLTARNRLVFGPHETNLGRRRQLSERHVAYYARRAAGGAGVIVVEEASVHESDWPYERAPLASECAPGWSAIAAACRDEGSLLLAAIGHSGGQGSSAYGQQALLGPSNVPDVATREVPKAMEEADISEVIRGFGAAAELAAASGCDGVEINAGQWSLLRQFCSGLTNERSDAWGEDRFGFLRRVLEVVRRAAPDGLVGLRFSCDELAPWAGLVPEFSARALERLASEGTFDYLTAVRGSAYGTGATRPDGHVPEGFNLDAVSLVREALGRSIAIVAQGSIVDAPMAEQVVAGGVADLVEMTRAFIADAELGLKVVEGEAGRIRPCILCNQACMVRDPRNPLVSCTTDPHAGYESVEPQPPTWAGGRGVPNAAAGLPNAAAGLPNAVAGLPNAVAGLIVIGAGPAGLECARVAALRGRKVTIFERRDEVGGMVRVAARAPGRERLLRLVEWLESECRLAGVEIVTGHEFSLEELDAHEGPVACCTGSRSGRRTYAVESLASVLTAAEVLGADPLVGEAPPSPAVVYDPVGGPIGIATAEYLVALGSVVSFVTTEFVPGDQLARTGDLAPASVRLQQAGVEISTRTVVRAVGPDGVLVENSDSGERRQIEAVLLVDAGHLLPEDSLYRAASASREFRAAGDAVAPRTILEAVLEGRRVAMDLTAPNFERATA